MIQELVERPGESAQPCRRARGDRDGLKSVVQQKRRSSRFRAENSRGASPPYHEGALSRAFAVVSAGQLSFADLDEGASPPTQHGTRPSSGRVRRLYGRSPRRVRRSAALTDDAVTNRETIPQRRSARTTRAAAGASPVAPFPLAGAWPTTSSTPPPRHSWPHEPRRGRGRGAHMQRRARRVEAWPALRRAEARRRGRPPRRPARAAARCLQRRPRRGRARRAGAIPKESRRLATAPGREGPTAGARLLRRRRARLAADCGEPRGGTPRASRPHSRQPR